MRRTDVIHRICAARTRPLAWAPTLIRDEMKYWRLRPDPRLQPEVRCYFIVEADRRQLCQHELHLPDGYSELVFTFRDGFDRAPLGSATEATRVTRSYMVGARSHSIVTRDFGNVRVVGVKLEPRMLRKLIKSPLADFRDSIVELRDLKQQCLLDLEESLAACPSPREVTAILDQFFLMQTKASAPTKTFVDDLIGRIRVQRGAIAISECTRDSGMDPRTLERTFAACVGMTPKKYARIVRFKHAYHALLTNAGPPRRARVDPNAYLDGYYDQSHFYKDFHFFTGTSPATLLASQTSASTAVTDHLLQGDLSAA